jgi:hypothetical protein
VKGSLLPFSWSTQYFTTLEPILKTATKRQTNGKVTTPTPKDNIVFVSCSILTPWLLHGKRADRDLEYFQGIWQEIQDNYDCSLIYCKCFDQVIAQRLGQTFLYADEKEQEVRTLLGEADFESISKLLERYENLLTSDFRKDGSSLADAVVYTVSTKQSVPALLSTFGLKPPPIPTFDFSHLQKRR